MNEIEAHDKLTYILNALKPYSIDLTLDRIKLLLEKCGNPQNSFKSIIVGGTNGKGSICQFLTDVFIDSGLKVGTYTSPHLVQLNERFRINNKSVSYSELLDGSNRLMQYNSLNLTYFEFLTALAFYIFKQNKIDIAVLEVGMGGEFDATNIANPILSIITHISLDHTEHLGKTHEEIAKTKAKIIKNIGVVGKNSNTVKKTIKQNVNVRLFFVDESYEKKAKGIQTLMKGEAVKENLATTLLAIDILNNIYEYNLDYRATQKSFWPGRFEVIKTKNKTFILDGAHNKNATLKLVASLKNYPDKVLIFSSLKSKNWKDNLKILMPHFNKIILTPIAEHKLSEDIETVNNFISKQTNTTICKNTNEAINLSFKLKEKTVVVAGSLYLIGETKACKIHNTFMP